MIVLVEIVERGWTEKRGFYWLVFQLKKRFEKKKKERRKEGKSVIFEWFEITMFNSISKHVAEFIKYCRLKIKAYRASICYNEIAETMCTRRQEYN